jgi:hypothetical protein
MDFQKTGSIPQIADAELPTRWGLFRALGFERRRFGVGSPETAVALLLGRPQQGGAPCADSLSMYYR